MSAAATSLNAHADNAVQRAEPHPGTSNEESCTITGKRARDVSEQDGKAQSAQPSAHVSPATRIYRHALESVFAMLQLQDLIQILAVSQSWSAAARSMKPIGAAIEREEWDLQRAGKEFRPLPPIRKLVTGPLLRHLAAIHIKVDADAQAEREAQAREDARNRAYEAPAEDDEEPPDEEPEEPAESPLFTSDSLALLAQHAPHLTSLWCDLQVTPDADLVFPASLTSLELRLWFELPADEINYVLETLAALPALQRLLLCCSVDEDDREFVDLSLLGSAPSLRDLDIEDLFARSSDLSDRQVAQIRSSLGHLQRFTFSSLDCEALDRLLQPPVTARWQDLGNVDGYGRTAALLVKLPTLTSVDLSFDKDSPRVNVLSQLPLLTSLKLSCTVRIPAPCLLAAVVPCVGLTELELNFRFNSAELSPLLAALTKLRKLTLWGNLDTLQCFAAGPATLEELCVYQPGPALPPAELVHLYVLQGLRSVDLSRVFDSLDEAAFASLTPPTVHLPQLTRCVHRDYQNWHSRVERTGPSFEWTQRRLAL